MGRSPLGHYLFNCQAPDAGNMELLHLYANHEQEEKFLKPLVAGECRSAFAMTEPEHAGSNPLWLSTTAVLEGDDYVVNGHKWFSTGFDGSSFLILMTITNPEAPKAHERASMLIIPNDTPGLIHVRKVKIMGEAGEGNHSHSELRFENCRVPQKNLLGKEGEGFLLAQQRLGPGRIHHCMRWIGICNRAFEMLCQRAATREISPGRVLGQKQSVQNWIVESKAEIQAARLMVLDAAEQMAQKGSKGARIEISLIKFFVADVLMKVLDRAIQAHGALGISDDILLSFWYRHERGARIYDGADEVHKQVVAREILREYGVRLEP
ncbi:MAG: acyl-CoA dehydrogenase family protein [Deinococcales bacterium]